MISSVPLDCSIFVILSHTSGQFIATLPCNLIALITLWRCYKYTAVLYCTWVGLWYIRPNMGK